MERRYFIRRVEMTPKVYLRLTDNWLELTVRFIARDHGTRELKDAMSREILAALDDAGIGIASSTFEVVGLPLSGLNCDLGPMARVERFIGRFFTIANRAESVDERCFGGTDDPPTMDRDGQADAIGHHDTRRGRCRPDCQPSSYRSPGHRSRQRRG